ncbi:glycosyltransferase family 2 protein [Haloglomus litoreum]|uniref:glycosyltransferase family 2 protein n=1 Tax=Haloglomus litoreum TaxID=3034026 RepID=UPI0023E7C126|nr:glycosyltransferase family 2 protein [Haloglomus sp. DT116]
MRDRTRQQRRGVVPAESVDRPALGLVADRANLKQLVRAVLRAQRHDYPVLVSCPEADSFVATVVRRLGATLVVPEGSHPDSEAVRRSLTATARRHGHPGLLFHRRLDERVAFEAVAPAFAEPGEYVVEAPTTASTSSGRSVLVGIPAFNEEDAIGAVIEESDEYADTVLVVDDGSRDRTGERATEAGAVVVEHESNRGYGGALKTLFREARQLDADHLVVVDGDGQHDTTDIPELVSTQRRTGSEIVIGNRFGSGTEPPLYRRVGLGIINGLMAGCLRLFDVGFRVRDAQSGFRAYDRRAIRSLAADASIGDRMDASSDILFHAARQGYDVTEVDTTITYDGEATSTHPPVAHGLRVVRSILRAVALERPMTVLGAPGFVGASAGLALVYWALATLVRTGTLPHHLTLPSILLTLGGLLACLSAVVVRSLDGYLDLDHH